MTFVEGRCEAAPGVLRLSGLATAAVLWLLVIAGTLMTVDRVGEIILVAVGTVLAPIVLCLANPLGRGGPIRNLRRAEEHVAVMAASGDELPWECDPLGNVTYAGELLTKHFGYQQHDLAGMNLCDLLHPQEAERLADLMAAGVGWQHQRWRGQLKDGTERWVIGNCVPRLSSDGTLLGFVGSCHRLSKDEHEEQRLSALADSIRDRLESGDILPVFQPILSVETGRLIGAEALSRFPGSDRNPELWFTQAAEVGLSVELEMVTLRASLAASHQLPDDIYLSLNVGPLTLVHPALVDVIVSSGIHPGRVVLEVTEHASISDYQEILATAAMLRATGIRFAVDDAGAGYASFRHILRLAPEFIKLDRSLIDGIDGDPARRALAAAVVMFGLEMHATIIAEGIETPEELRCAQTLGIDAAQGYLFGRPTADWTTWNEWHRHGPLYSVTAANAQSQRTRQ